MACGCSLLAHVGLWQLLGTAPRTVSFEIDRWNNDSWGLHNIVRDRIAGTVGIFADGSRVNSIQATHYKHYFIRSGDWPAHSIYIRPANIGYEINDGTRTATLWRCTCTWEESQPPPPDASCIAAARAGLGANVAQVGSGEIAGAPVIRYKETGSNDQHEIAFAPKFGCDILEERSATYNAIGLPTSRFHYIVRSYLPGNPAQSLLAPPTGYVLREKPL